MMINLLPNVAPQPAQNTRNSGLRAGSSAGTDFDSLMSGLASSRDDVRTKSANEGRDSRSFRRERVSESGHGDVPRGTLQNAATENPAETPVNEGSEQDALDRACDLSGNEAVLSKNDAVLDENDAVLNEEKLLAELAAALGISVFELVEIIQNLEIDLADLLEAENRIELLIEAKGMGSQVELLSMPEALPVLQEMTVAVEKHMISANENQAHLNLWTQEADVLTEAKSELVDMGELALGDLAEGEEETADLTQTVSERSSQTVSATAAQGQADLVSMFAEQDALQANVMPEVSVNPLPVVDVSSNTAQVADSAPVSQTVTPQNIAEQIVQNVRYVSGEQMAEIRIQLKPEHLGELSLRIATINGIVTAQFLAENQRVKELIEAGFNHLKDALEQAGINISDIEVNVSTGDGQWDDETEGHVSDKRIRGLMGADVGEVDEVPLAREENLVDYRV